jgi:hypothetical protein
VKVTYDKQLNALLVIASAIVTTDQIVDSISSLNLTPGIGQHHRPIDPPVCVWCNSLRALCIDGIESRARKTVLPDKDAP